MFFSAEWDAYVHPSCVMQGVRENDEEALAVAREVELGDLCTEPIFCEECRFNRWGCNRAVHIPDAGCAHAQHCILYGGMYCPNNEEECIV